MHSQRPETSDPSGAGAGAAGSCEATKVGVGNQALVFLKSGMNS